MDDLIGRGSSSLVSLVAWGLGDTSKGLGLGKMRDFGENMAGVGDVATGSKVNSTLLVLTFSGSWVVTAGAGEEGGAGWSNGAAVGEKRGMVGDPWDNGSFFVPSWKNWKFPRPSLKWCRCSNTDDLCSIIEGWVGSVARGLAWLGKDGLSGTMWLEGLS